MIMAALAYRPTERYTHRKQLQRHRISIDVTCARPRRHSPWVKLFPAAATATTLFNQSYLGSPVSNIIVRRNLYPTEDQHLSSSDKEERKLTGTGQP